jgi:NADH:ubiquinone oxidoreductase subunit F (NADH-binding)
MHRGDPCLPFVRAAAAERMSRRPDQVPVELADVPTGYVTSEETALVNWLNGVAALPTVAPPRPAQRGVGHAPTLVQNVETLAHLALVARFGPGWFRALGTAADPGTMLLTVHGTRDTAGGPGVYEVPGGARAADVLAAAGGLPSGCPGVLVGGYGGRWLPADVLLGTTLDAAGLGGPLGCGLLLALPPGACGVRELARVGRWMAGESAGQCGPCAFGLPAISGTLDLLAAGRLDAAGFARLSRWTGQVRGRGACRHPDGTAQFVDSGLATFASEVDAHLRGGCAADPRVGPVCPLRDTDDPALLQRQAGGGTGWWR